MTHRLIAAAAVAAALVVPASPALAKSCASSAAITSGTIVRPAYTEVPPDPAAPSQSPQLVRDPAKDRPLEKLTRVPALVTSTHATVEVQHVKYTLGEGTSVRLTCFGETKSEGAIFPNLAILQGWVKVKAPAGHPGGVSTSGALVNPFQRAGQTFKVQLTGEHQADYEPPITKVTKLAGSGLVNVTPYVGPQPGTCRDVKTAKLVMASRKHPHGLAYYDGRLAH